MRYIAMRYIAMRYIAMRYIAIYLIAMRYIAMRYIAMRYEREGAPARLHTGREDDYHEDDLITHCRIHSCVPAPLRRPGQRHAVPRIADKRTL